MPTTSNMAYETMQKVETSLNRAYELVNDVEVCPNAAYDISLKNPTYEEIT